MTVPDSGGSNGSTSWDVADAQELDSLGFATGVEMEALSETDVAPVGGSNEPVEIRNPFDPDKIDIITRTPTVELLLSRIRDGRIDLEPEFQRQRGIWSPRAKSRLIESLLLRIPLPTLYAAEVGDEEGSWTVVDGIQRLTAISEFVEPSAIRAEPLVLRDLEYLSQYQGSRFSDLPGRLQTRLREAELVVHLIRLGTPEPVKFNIFARINTGGTPLSSQELRHALIGGPARDCLRRWAESEEFRRATGNSIRSERMADREMVLRFVAFHLAGPQHYRSPDFDDFLRKAMLRLNELSRSDTERLERDFLDSLESAHRIFNPYTFRKRSLNNPERLSPVNKALFETITVNLAAVAPDQRQQLARHRERVHEHFLGLMDDDYFVSAVSVGTGAVSRVRYRFDAIRQLFAAVLK